MTHRPLLAIATTAALCAPAAALAAHHRSTVHASSTVNCGGSGVNSQYCIPQQSTFAFTGTSRAPHCSLKVQYTVEPDIHGLTGHAHLDLKGTGHGDRRISRVARPLVEGGPLSYTFTHVHPGPYLLSGWYEGDGTRLPSTHHSEHVTVHCG
jgi:hypothetical protein